MQDLLQQGQSPEKVSLAVFAYRYQRSPNLLETLPASPLRASLRPDAPTDLSDGDRLEQIRKDLEVAVTEYRLQVSQEFLGLPSVVQDAFNRKDLEFYRENRPQYYRAGYKQPAQQIFRDIQPYTFLGHPVRGGIHRAMIPKLEQARTYLETWRTGLSAEMGKQIAIVGGFVPRKVEGSQKLSNHAFGLSIDIDSITNPHIKGEMVPVLDAIAKESGFSYGQRFVPPANLAPEEWAKQTHEAAAKASELVKAWLQVPMPRHEALQTEIQTADAVLKAETSTPEQKQAAKEAKAKAQKTLSEDEEMKRLQILMRDRDHKAKLAAWKAHGIQTIPQYLAMALVKAGLRWGQTYINSKDGMHFELLYEDVIPR